MVKRRVEALPQSLSIESMIKPWILPGQRDYYLTHATVVDPQDGSTRENTTVHLSNGLVKAVYPSGSEATPTGSSGSVTIDLSGRYICPGLIDCHVHVATPPGENGLAATMSQDPTTALLRQPWLLKQMLHRGFTTIRDCGGASFALKEAVSENLHPGPRMFISCHAISQTGGHGDRRSSKTPDYEGCSCSHFASSSSSSGDVGNIADGADACLRAARSQLRQGADFIKIMCSGGVASPTDTLTATQYTAAEITSLTSVAQAANTYVSAHAYTPAAITQAIRHGVGAIEHGNLIDEPTAHLMASKNVFLTPTLVTYDTMASPDFAGFLPPGNAAKNTPVLRAGLESLRLADEAGVMMCFGTDLLGALQVRQTREFSLRAQVLSSLKVLQSATVNAARLLRMEHRLGRVEVGFCADLIVLERNPCVDVAVLDSSSSGGAGGEGRGGPLVVFKDGRVMMSRLPGVVSEV